jgi:hypothetical protein
MGTAELRKEAHRFIERANDKDLKKVLALAKKHEKTVIVGYEPDGTPISQEDLKKRVRKASTQVKAGNYSTQEDLEKEVEDW